MSALVVPFPLARRRDFVQRQARMIANMAPEKGEKYLQRQLLTQFDVLERRGVDCDVIYREIESLDRAIRAALWRAVLTPDRPA